MRYIILLVCVAFGVSRLTMPVVSEVHHEDIYKDAAHIFVGGLFGACAMAYAIAYRMARGGVFPYYVKCDGHRYLLYALSLTVLEIVAFILHKA